MQQRHTAHIVLINHRAGDLRAALRDALPDGAHAVVDPVGGELSEPALRSLRRGGRFVTVGYASGVIPRIPLNLVLVKGVTVLGFQFQDVPPDEFVRNEDELRELLATGTVSPHIGAVYPLAETSRALRHVADGKAVGKVLIDIAESPKRNSSRPLVELLLLEFRFAADLRSRGRGPRLPTASPSHRSGMSRSRRRGLRPDRVRPSTPGP